MDHRRYGEAQQEPFRRAAGEAFQNGFELAACFFLERVSHQVHAEQEQREPAGQREYIENVHGILLFLQFLYFVLSQPALYRSFVKSQGKRMLNVSKKRAGNRRNGAE